ncbi:MAG TPA: hypothetical protein VFM54_15435 [Micromonosporaceae bacterium]|nr:hypothetical protein [Micromonosporaceae bacterium]
MTLGGGGRAPILALATAAPAHAIYAKMSNTLDAPAAIGGVVPAGVGNIDQCRSPGYLFDLTVDVNSVNLPDGTSLTVTYRGTDGHPEGATPLGSFVLSNGNGHFSGSRSGPAGANDNLYVLNGGTIILTATDRWDATQFSC